MQRHSYGQLMALFSNSVKARQLLCIHGKMQLLPLLIAACVCTSAVPAALSAREIVSANAGDTEAPEPHYLVVLDLHDDNSGLSGSALNYYSEVVRKIADRRRAGFLVMDKQNIQLILSKFGLDLAKCVGGSCVVDVGRKLKADIVASGTIFKLDTGYRVMLSLHDTKTTASISKIEVVSPTEKDLEKNLKAEVDRLFDPLVDYVTGSISGAGAVESGIVGNGISVDLGERIENRITDEKGFLTVTSHRKGETGEARAMVRLNNQDPRPAPFTDEFMSGDYVVSARLDDYYYIATKKIHLGTDSMSVDLELLPAFGGIEIETEPGDAEILINDRAVSRTSSGRKYSDLKLKSNTYRVEVRRSLYKPSKRAVTVRDGIVTSETIKLEPDFGNIAVSSEPGGVTVFLNGKEVGKTKEGKEPVRLNNLPTGVHSLRLVKDLYLPEERQVRVGDGKTFREHFDLKSNFGGLKVSSDPEGASIILDDKPTGKVTPATLHPLTPGVHFVTVKKDGYGSPVEKANVVDGRTQDVKVVLQPKLGLLSVLVEKEDGSPCNGVVFIDGAEVGKTPWKGKVLAVEHKVEARCPEGSAGRTLAVVHNDSVSAKLKVGKRGNLIVDSAYQDGSRCVGKLRLNGTIKGETPWNDWIETGPYRVRVDCAEGVGEADVRVTRGDRINVKLEVSGRPVYSPWPWVTAGIGAAVIVSGGVLTAFADKDLAKIANAEKDESGHVIGITQEEARALESRANTRDNAATAMYTIGSAAIVTGLIWGIIDVAKVNKTRKQTRSRARFSGILIPGGGGVGIAGAF